MIYPFQLQAVGIAVGTALIVAHLLGWWKSDVVRKKLPEFPRSRLAGTILTALATVWALWLVATIDLGEFSGLRRLLVILVPVAGFLTIRFVDEFLSVRALGFLALLAAEPLLEAAFLKLPVTRLLLVVLAYGWVVAGLFWVGMPYLLRDQIAWAVRSPLRWKGLMGAGMAYGLALIFCALAFWRV